MSKKYLIIRFSSAGDIVLTTPVVRCLKKQTGAEVHFLTKKAFRTLMEPNPYLDKIFSIEKNISEVLPALKKEGYDAVIDLHKNLRTRQVKSAISAPSYSFDKINFKKWLIVNFKINRLPDLHIVDRYLATVAPLGVKNDGAGLDYFLPSGENQMQNSVSKKIPEIDFSKPFLAFAIGAAHATKRIPEGMISEICQKADLPVFLLGGPAEAEVGQRIKEAVSCVSATLEVRGRNKVEQKANLSTKIVNTCGKLSWHESAFLLKKSAKVITPDTGLMHIAAAFKKEIIAIWGNTVPEFGMYPYYGDSPDTYTDFEVKNLSCRPCSKIGYEKCPKGHFKCMREQDLTKIIEKI